MHRPTRVLEPLRAILGSLARGLATTSSGLPITITPSGQEIASARLGQRSIQRVLEALARDGLVVIENVVDHASIDALNEVMVKDAKTLMERGEDGPFNYNLGEYRFRHHSHIHELTGDRQLAAEPSVRPGRVRAVHLH